MFARRGVKGHFVGVLKKSSLFKANYHSLFEVGRPSVTMLPLFRLLNEEKLWR
jgi:hypothetical protein